MTTANVRSVGRDRHRDDPRDHPSRRTMSVSMELRRRVGLLALAALLALSACTSAARTSESSYDALPDPVFRTAIPGDPLTCTDRATIPQLDQVTTAKWSPDSSALAFTRIVRSLSRKTITGFEEDLRVSVLSVARGTVREVGPGKLPEWSASGAYLSYWHDDGFLHIFLGGTNAGTIEATQPSARWVGEQLLYWYKDEIRLWEDGRARTLARVDPALRPRFPADDAYFSADGERFTLARYSQDGGTERYLGVTRTGELTPLGAADIRFTEWSPRGRTLLLRSTDRLTLLAADGAVHSAPLASFKGPVHGWTADGRLMVGAMSPTVRGSFDRYYTWDGGASDEEVATLPNLFGARAFSPDGRWFAGASRTGLYTEQLELYRCGSSGAGTDLRADPIARSRAQRIESDAQRFVIPAAGAMLQFVQGRHTGVDVAAPFGSLLFASDDGVVNEIGWVPVGGYRVCVLHAGGLESCDYHTSLSLVKVGDRVARGQPVALVGMTGQTTGAHVHWEAKRDGMIVDPLAQ